MKKLIPFLTILSILAFSSCKKSDTGVAFQTTLTSKANTGYDEINIDITGMLVQYSSDTTTWVPVRTMTGLYNVRTIEEPANMLLADDRIASGEIRQVRFLLGTNSNVVVGGTMYPLQGPADDDASLRLMVNKSLDGSGISLEFDSPASVIDDGGGSYRLVPVIAVK
jgi:hypothetical protein